MKKKEKKRKEENLSIESNGDAMSEYLWYIESAI